MAFDLSAYLERIRLPVAPEPDVDGLVAVQRAHRLAIPFENLDVKLGRGVRIDPDTVFAKLVTARRGGYCFEHNRLFGDALDALGFRQRPLLARVWLGQTEVPPLTHTLTLVTVDGQDWIADPGFGGSYCPPMPLVDGAVAEAPDGATFRLGRDPAHGWMLQRFGAGASTDGREADPEVTPGAQYSFTLDPVFPADLAMGNHWVQSWPGSRFVMLAIASLVLPRGFASLTDRGYKRASGDQVADGTIDDPRQYRMRLSLMFGIDLSAEEVGALGLF